MIFEIFKGFIVAVFKILEFFFTTWVYLFTRLEISFLFSVVFFIYKKYITSLSLKRIPDNFPCGS